MCLCDLSLYTLATRERQLPVLCMPDDAAYLRARGLNVPVPDAEGPSGVLGGTPSTPRRIASSTAASRP